MLTNLNQQTPKERDQSHTFHSPDKVWGTNNPWRQTPQKKLWRRHIINPLSSPGHESSWGTTLPAFHTSVHSPHVVILGMMLKSQEAERNFKTLLYRNVWYQTLLMTLDSSLKVDYNPFKWQVTSNAEKFLVLNAMIHIFILNHDAGKQW